MRRKRPCRTTEQTIENFWSKVDKTDTCWIWKAGKDKDGYGIFCNKTKSTRAHRYSWEITNGIIPDGLMVLHTCDNPSCVKPDHLFLGTSLDNAKDMVRKGRSATGDKSGARLHPEKLRRGNNAWQHIHPELVLRGDKSFWHNHPEIWLYGEKNPAAKLSKQQVKEIREKYIPRKYGHRKLAEEYGVHKHLIYLILKNKLWVGIT